MQKQTDFEIVLRKRDEKNMKSTNNQNTGLDKYGRSECLSADLNEVSNNSMLISNDKAAKVAAAVFSQPDIMSHTLDAHLQKLGNNAQISNDSQSQ